MLQLKNESSEVLEVFSKEFKFTLSPGEEKSVRLSNEEMTIYVNKAQAEKRAFRVLAFVLAQALNLLNFFIVQDLLKVIDFIEYPIKFEIGSEDTVVVLTEDSESNAICTVQCNGINIPFQLICDDTVIDKAVKEYRMYILSCFWLPFLALIAMSILLIITKLYTISIILFLIMGAMCFWLYKKEKMEKRNLRR